MKPQVERTGRKSSAPRGRPSFGPLTNRSKVTNGSLLGYGFDMRSREGRRWRDIYRQYMEASGNRHEQLCRGLASLVLRREQLDGAMARGEHVDADLLIKLSGEIRRTLTRLNINTADAQSTPTLDQYLATKYGIADDNAEDVADA
jgi:hypothetical protein